MKGLEEVLSTPIKLADVDPASYDVIFVVGGHGPMQDLAVDPNIGDILAAMLDNPSKIVASVCHGPASFLSAATRRRRKRHLQATLPSCWKIVCAWQARDTSPNQLGLSLPSLMETSSLVNRTTWQALQPMQSCRSSRLQPKRGGPT